MLARVDALREVGGFDERYFLYWEDADLCRRLRRAGHHVRYVPSATAVHRVGHSSSKVRVPALKAFHASAYLYYATHVAPGAANPKRLLARALLARAVLVAGESGDAVGRQHAAPIDTAALGQRELHAVAGIAEHRHAGAEQERVDVQPDFVHKAGAKQ